MVMDGAFNHQEERELTQRQSRTQILQLKACLPLVVRPRGSGPPTSPNPFPLIGLWVSKSVRALYLNYRARVSCGFCCKRLDFEGMVVNNSVFEKEKVTMEDLVEKDGSFEQESEKLCEIRSEVDTSGSLVEESSSSSDFLSSETTGHDEEQSRISSEDSASPASVSWAAQKATEAHDCSSPNCTNHAEEDERKLEKQDSTVPEIELMKERFAKLLLGEDMSGSGNGVCTALAVSNAITNLCATIFGQIWRLEPLPQEKKAMWRREMEWLLSVSDHIVEFIPSWQTFPDGSKLEVMTCRPRSDLYVNLPALKKLDNMLLELLDSFVDTEFWYVDQGIVAQEADGSHSFRRALQRQEEKWWLPVPRVPPAGLSEDSRKQLQHRRDCTNQILKAAMAINSITLADMEIPDSYLESLPKNGRATLGDLIYRYISSDQFSPEYLLDCLDLSSEHHAFEIANRVEASIHVFNRKMSSRPVNSTSRSSSRSSWEMVKELVTDAEKRELLADRAESILLCLKQRFPGLPQTTLDMSKIQCNKDVGKSILESYSRVLESLAFNIVARIDDLLHVDNLTKHLDQLPSMSIISQKSTVTIPYQVPTSSTPYRTAFSTPAQLISPARVERSPYTSGGKITHRGLGVRKVLTDYLNIDILRGKDHSSSNVSSNSVSSVSGEGSPSFELVKESACPSPSRSKQEPAAED